MDTQDPKGNHPQDVLKRSVISRSPARRDAPKLYSSCYFLFGPSRCAVAILRASQVRFFKLRLKERYPLQPAKALVKQHVIKYAIGIRRAWFFAKQKPCVSEPGVARPEGIAQIIFFMIFFIWAFPQCGRRLAGFTGSVF